MRKSIVLIAIFTAYFVFGHYQVHCQNNQNSNNNQQPQPNQNVTVTEPVKVLLEPDIEQIESEKGYKTRQEKRDETNATWNRTGIVINSLLFILVLVQAFLSLRGLREMRRQADIVESQAKTMKEQSETMQVQAKVMEDTLEETRSIIKQNERAIKASNRQARVSESALEYTKESLVITERAYIGIKDIILVRPLRVGEYPVLKVVFINGGRTPARDFEAIGTPSLNAKDLLELKQTIPFTIEKSGVGSFLPANDVKTILFELTDTTMTENRLARINSGEWNLYIFIKTFYKDFQNTEQTFLFCARYLSKFGNFEDCGY